MKYRTRRNKKTDLTEYYNLIYEYKNDCLTAAIQYMNYYSDKDLKPNEEIFSISIVPFSKINYHKENENIVYKIFDNFSTSILKLQIKCYQ